MVNNILDSEWRDFIIKWLFVSVFRHFFDVKNVSIFYFNIFFGKKAKNLVGTLEV